MSEMRDFQKTLEVDLRLNYSKEQDQLDFLIDQVFSSNDDEVKNYLSLRSLVYLKVTLINFVRFQISLDSICWMTI